MNYYTWLLQFLHCFCKARLHFLLSIASFIISFFQVSNAQATASLKIKFPLTWDLNKVQVFFNNGKDKRPLKPISATHQFVVKDSFYATYATITVSYSINENISLTNIFFLSDKPASIFFTSDPQKANNPLDTYTAKNIVGVYKTPAGKRFMLALKKDYEDYKQLMLKLNIDNKYNTDSLEYILNVRDSIIQKKELEFIRNNGNYYFSLWLFRQRFDYTYIQGSPDTLLSIFSSSFSPKLKNSPEGIQMNDILEGWTAIKQ